MSRKRDWLARYLDLTSHIESPEAFHLWVGISCISAVLGRSVWLDMGYGAIYPNFYIVLVAPPGRCRKGAAAKQGLRLLQFVEKPNAAVKGGVGRLCILWESITKRSLTKTMGEQVVLVERKPLGESRVYVYSPEFSVLMGGDAAASGLLDVLLTLYDCPDVWEHRTSSQGSDFLFNSWLSILGCSTPSLLSKCVLNETVGGGITSRTIFVARTETPRRSHYFRKEEEWFELEKSLLSDLNEIAKVKGQLTVSPEALEFYGMWYADREVPKDERFASFYEREHDHVLKVAMVLAASEGSLFKAPVINVKQITEAIRMVEGVKESMHLVYQGLGEHPAARGYDRVFNQIVEAGGEMEHSALLRKNWYWYNKEIFREIMELLEETGKIRRHVTKSGKTLYRVIPQREE